jgi:hypothetical protein
VVLAIFYFFDFFKFRVKNEDGNSSLYTDCWETKPTRF